MITPEFLESQLAKGRTHDAIDKAYLRSGKDSKYEKFRSMYTSRYGSTSTGSMLNYYVYGTTNPKQTVSEVQPENDGGLVSKIKERNVQAFGTESGLIDAALNPSETVQSDSAAGRLLRGEQGVGQTAFDVAGAGAGAIGDVIGAGVSTVAKGADFISGGLLGEGVEAVVESEVGQAVGEFAGDIASQYQIFKEKFPEAARNLESTVNIASLIPLSKVPGSIVKGGKKLKNAKGAVSASKAAGSTDDVAKLLQPKRTKKELQELFKKNPEVITKSKGGKIISSKGPKPTTSELKMAEELQRIVPEISSVKKPIDAGPVIFRKIAEKGKFVDDALENNNFALPRKESLATVKKAIQSTADDFGESPGIFNAELNRFTRFRNKFPGTGAGERASLKAYDADTASRFGTSIYQKGTARADAVRAVREASQQTLENAAQRVGVPYLSEIKDMSTLYNALDNVSTHVSPAVFESTLKSAIKTPLGRSATQAAGVSAGVGLIP